MQNENRPEGRKATDAAFHQKKKKKSKGCIDCRVFVSGDAARCGPCALKASEREIKRREEEFAAEFAALEEAAALKGVAPIHVILDSRPVVRGESAELGPDGAKVWFRSGWVKGV
ncbi:hypothetical protein TSOC_008741 [Tetrabaena socialis]|uniref:Uncharacterized protein n=1 Tax=Tetrabaena socialis TaxID=47790 RepID=A0A2J7ZXL4_9CHLO|nr:hypothetical protein TSOC_008741 [Tetrabaena socialis]|eukprot:PNH05014.1 hypothetical protein TSOC_008741 [Tetrabaena socialis]